MHANSIKRPLRLESGVGSGVCNESKRAQRLQTPAAALPLHTSSGLFGRLTMVQLEASKRIATRPDDGSVALLDNDTDALEHRLPRRLLQVLGERHRVVVNSGTDYMGNYYTSILP